MSLCQTGPLGLNFWGLAQNICLVTPCIKVDSRSGTSCLKCGLIVQMENNNQKLVKKLIRCLGHWVLKDIKRERSNVTFVSVLLQTHHDD